MPTTHPLATWTPDQIVAAVNGRAVLRKRAGQVQSSSLVVLVLAGMVVLFASVAAAANLEAITEGWGPVEVAGPSDFLAFAQIIWGAAALGLAMVWAAWSRLAVRQASALDGLETEWTARYRAVAVSLPIAIIALIQIRPRHPQDLAEQVRWDVAVSDARIWGIAVVVLVGAAFSLALLTSRRLEKRALSYGIQNYS